MNTHSSPPPVSIPAWLPPWSYRGDLGNVRVSTSALGQDLRWNCPERTAKNARPSVWPDTPYVDRPKAEWGTFWLGMVRTAILSVLGADGAAPAPDAKVAVTQAAAGERRWPFRQPSIDAALAAVDGYLQVLDRIRAAETGWEAPVTVVADIVATDITSDGVINWVTWAVSFIRDGGTTWETHLLRYRDAGQRPLPPARVAAVARALADGYVADPGDRYYDTRSASPRQPTARPNRVIVREVGLLNHSDHVLVDTTAPEARRLFTMQTPTQTAVLAGGATHAGTWCADRATRFHCPGIPTRAGILGVTVHSAWTRAVTPSDLTDQAACPRRAHLSRDLGLPRAPAVPGPALLRGQRVHRWLEAAHGRGVACTADDLPSDRLPPLAVELNLDTHEYRAVRPWLVNHLDSCPLRDPDAFDHAGEAEAVVWDTDANVVMSTRINHTHRHPRNGRILREVKTVSPRRLPETETELLDLFPQVSFAVACLADGYDPVERATFDPDTAGPGLVQLELLGEDHGVVVEFRPDDPDTALAARVALADAVDDRITDRQHAAMPGRHCTWCRMRDWCQPDLELDPAAASEDVGEDTSAQPRHTILEVIRQATVETDQDDEIPF